MTSLQNTIAGITPLNSDGMVQAQRRLDGLTKPLGSLGRLEELARTLVAITGKNPPSCRRKLVVTMAADHGVVQEGVSAYPSEVTYQMVLNFLRGGAGINVLARAAGARVLVVDMGVNGDFEPATDGLLHRKMGRGTANMAKGPAMTRAQAEASVRAGIEIIDQQVREGLDLVGTGDMGIGNTTASSAISAALLGVPVDQVTGRGTGIDDEALANKVRVIERALKVNKPDSNDPLDVLAKVGGFEIGGLAGVILGAAKNKIPVLIDGFNSGAAALLAATMCPVAVDYMIAAHCSVERGHRHILNALKLKPLLDLDLRLGEGTGAALAMHLVEAAVKIYTEMATFESAGVSGKQENIASGSPRN